MIGYPEKDVQAPIAPLPPTSPKPKNLKPISSLRKKYASSTNSNELDNINCGESSNRSRHSSLSSLVLMPSEVYEDDSELESSVDEEANELESESGDEELESEASEAETIDWHEDGFESFDVHPMHCNPRPNQPLSFPGCKTASQMAVTAAADANIGIRQHRLIRTRLSEGELIFNTLTLTQVIPLMHAEVAYTACTGKMAKGRSVIVIMPEAGPPVEHRSSKASNDSRRPSIKAMFLRRVPSENEKTPAIYGWVFYCDTCHLPAVLEALGEHGCTRSNLLSHYQTSGGSIGSGTYGSVVHATSTSTGAMAAVKALKQGTTVEQMHSEVNMLVRAQGHDKIIKFRGCFCEAEPSPRWFLVFDVHPYGDLYDRVASCTRMTEKDAMPLVRDLCEALKHLHAKQIFHRDVKPENLLMANGRHKGVVLTDFGIATLVTNQAELQRPVGTIGYASPEMLKGEATSFEGDAFGVGIVLYFMLSKSTPFLAPTNKLMVEMTEACKVKMKYSCFEHISDDCRNMILQFLKKDVKERLSVEQALMSRIIRKTYVTATEPSLPPSITEPRRTGSKSVLQRESMVTNQENAEKPQHHLIALTAGELPELTRLHK